MRPVVHAAMSDRFLSRFLDPGGPCIDELLATGQLADRTAGALCSYLETQRAAEKADGRAVDPEGDALDAPVTTHLAVLQ